MKLRNVFSLFKKSSGENAEQNDWTSRYKKSSLAAKDKELSYFEAEKIK